MYSFLRPPPDAAPMPLAVRENRGHPSYLFRAFVWIGKTLGRDCAIARGRFVLDGVVTSAVQSWQYFHFEPCQRTSRSVLITRGTQQTTVLDNSID